MTFTSADLASLIERSRKLHVGLEDQFDRMWRIHNSAQTTTSYPPYNIINNGDEYTVEIAVAGFREEELDIEVRENQLIVTGKVKSQEITEDGPQFLHRGIAARQFERTFILSDDVVVEDAGLENGMLVIKLRHLIPESKKPRKIPIGKSKPNEIKLLTEEEDRGPVYISEDISVGDISIDLNN